jgi:hypothetical protein
MAWDAAFVATATWAKPEQLETFRRNLDDGAFHLLGQVRILTRDGAAELVNGADGEDDVIEDTKLHGDSLGGMAGPRRPAPKSAPCIVRRSRTRLRIRIPSPHRHPPTDPGDR